jgi:hypothetical protein
MPKADRLRVDYMPCQAAIEALKAAQELYLVDDNYHGRLTTTMLAG